MAQPEQLGRGPRRQGRDLLDLNHRVGSLSKSTAFLGTQPMVEFMGHGAQRRHGGSDA